MYSQAILFFIHLNLVYSWLQFSSNINVKAIIQKSSSTNSYLNMMSSEIKTEDLKNKFNNVVQTTYGRYPLVISHGKGTLIYDINGKEYQDFAAGISTCCLGHSNPDLTQAVVEQMNRIHHCSNLYYIPKQGELAQWLVDSSCANKVFFCNSGAEANEAAIKLARKYAHTKLNINKPIIITAKSSFHGRTLAAVTATGQPKYHNNFDYGGDMVQGFEYCEFNNIESIKTIINNINLKKNNGDNIGLAAIMLEPLQGEGGIRPGDVNFFKQVREICDNNNALLICDEVQTGMGRTGKMWGHQILNIEPDIFTSAKAIGGGIPLGAMLCKDSCNVFEPGDHASTYGGNPLACAAGLAVAKVFERDNIIQNVKDRSKQMIQGLEKLKSKYPTLISDVRGWGLMLGLELTETSGMTASDVAGVLMNKGMLVVPAGLQVLRFVPPLIVTEDDVINGLQKLEDAILSLVK